jgi:MYXO-CTERM domain-containing protein
MAAVTAVGVLWLGGPVAQAAPPSPGLPSDRIALRADGMRPGVVPFRAAASGAVRTSAIAQCSNPRVSYFGGPVLQAPVVIAVFWNSSVNSMIKTTMGQFYADVVQSPYWDALHEYDTVGTAGGTGQAILEGTGGGGFTIVPARCASSSACNLTDDEVQTELARQIGLGFLPAPVLDCTGNVRTVYMVSFPYNVSLTGPTGTGTSCVNGGFCAYHNTGTYGANGTPLIYAAIMDTFAGGCKTGCGANATPFDNATETASHELLETATDPDIGLDIQSGYASPAAWGDNNNMCGEISDICDDGGPGDNIAVSGRTWVVQEFWSNAQRKCTSTAAIAQVCTGATAMGCRKCSCGDDGVACGGAAPVCETDPSSAFYGACQACTTSGPSCAGGGTCVGDQCVGGDAGIVDSGGSTADSSASDSGPSGRAEAGVDAHVEASALDGAGPDDAQQEPPASPDVPSPPDATTSGNASADAQTPMAPFDSAVAPDAPDGDMDGGDDGGGSAGRPSGCGCRAAGGSSPLMPAGLAMLGLLYAMRSRRRRLRVR